MLRCTNSLQQENELRKVWIKDSFDDSPRKSLESNWNFDPGGWNDGWFIALRGTFASGPMASAKETGSWWILPGWDKVGYDDQCCDWSWICLISFIVSR